MRPAPWLLAALAALAACTAGNVTLNRRAISPIYSAGEFAAVAAGRDLWTVIVGNPFGADQGAFEPAVTGAMQGQHWGQRTNFTTRPGESANIRFRVVLLFDPPRSFNGDYLCRNPPSELPTGAARDGIVLFAAYCRGKRLRTQIEGRIKGASGPDDPVFRELVGQVTNALFPANRGGRDRGDPWFLAP